MNTEIQRLFHVQPLENGFVLLNFIGDEREQFNRCMEMFKKNTVMQEHVFFDKDAVMYEIPNFPIKVSILRPSNHASFDVWDIFDAKGDHAFLEVRTIPYSEVQNCFARNRALGVKGQRFAFLFSKTGGEALSL